MSNHNRVAIVTGAGRGVGAATVRKLIEQDTVVIGVDRDWSGCPDAPRQEIRLTFDTGNENAGDAMIAVAMDRCGQLDLLVNNAGITKRCPLTDTSDDLYHEVMRINLDSAFRSTRAAARVMRPGASIVNIASINAIRGNLDLTAYSASKGGLTALTRAAATELAPHGIRVNAVLPGTLNTPMTEDWLTAETDRTDLERRLTAKHPLGRFGTAEDIAAAVAFLASEDASWITGVCLPVDGGRHML